MYKITTAERMLQHLVCEYEKLTDPRLPACCRKSGRLLETCCSIMDLKGVGLSKVSSVYSYVRSVTDISQNYYPERLGKLYIINAPWGFSSAFSFVKSFLDPVTVQKINILGSGYLDQLLAQVPKENLPKQFGGDCECEGGCALSDAGPWQDPTWAKPPKWAHQSSDEGKLAEEQLNHDQHTTTIINEHAGPQPVDKGETNTAPSQLQPPEAAAAAAAPQTAPAS